VYKFKSDRVPVKTQSGPWQLRRDELRRGSSGETSSEAVRRCRSLGTWRAAEIGPDMLGADALRGGRWAPAMVLLVVALLVFGGEGWADQRRAGRRTAAGGCSARPRTRRLFGPETRRRWLLCSAWEEDLPGLGGGRRQEDGPGLRRRSFSSAVAGRRGAGGWAGRRGAGGGASCSSRARVCG
jgi:hypothetical protein